jgi:hypothetical protein
VPHLAPRVSLAAIRAARRVDPCKAFVAQREADHDVYEAFIVQR